MKLTELMIGDWVICNHYQDKPFTKQFGVADFAKGEYEFCEPIPLTKEILEKNGFTIDKGYAVCQLAENNYLDFYLFEHRLRRVWEIVDEWNNHAKVRDLSFVCQCYYVHEFQHALRLVGIEKELIID